MTASSGAPAKSVEVRPAEPRDSPEIAEVHVRTWQAAYRHALPSEVLEELSVDESEAEWRRRIEHESAAVWVAHTQGRVVGPHTS
jgi:hypothetical protein